ncbi:MAG: hypothetical protein JWR15_2527 [Prosthecobacter sp.]|nr:hypothetical protein [Prosthecobacter sp.]
MVVMKIIPALLTLLLASALPTRADVISQTLDFGSFNGGHQYYFNQFNTALGTLTEVTLDWTINSTITSAVVTNKNTGTVTLSKIAFTNLVEGYVPSMGENGPLVAEALSGKTVNATGSRTLTQDQSYTMTNITMNPFTQTDNYTVGDDSFNSFKGTGSVPIYLTNTFGATPTATGAGSTTTSWLTTITGSTSGNLNITYTYSAAPPPPVAPVPEPPALILGFGSLLCMAGFAFKRGTPKTAVAELV